MKIDPDERLTDCLKKAIEQRIAENACDGMSPVRNAFCVSYALISRSFKAATVSAI